MIDTSAPPPASVLLHVHETLGVGARSGVQRVVVKLARELATRSRLELVRWDAQSGALRFCDRQEHDALFGRGAWPDGIAPRLEARGLRRRFADALQAPERTWLLQPELPYHSVGGMQPFTTAVTQAREYGLRTAAVFYDLIPVTNPDYADHLERHLRYLAELTRLDLVLPISAHSGRVLEGYMQGRGLQLPPVRPVLLAESDVAQVRPAAGPEQCILMVGTVEPRKRQLAVLRAYAAARRRSPAVAALPLVVVGSLHGAVAEAFNALVAATPGVSYRAYLPEAELEQAWREAAFSVFASDDEGYGLPVAESLARGVPCLAADVAPITEIAGGAGVLHVDVTSDAAIADGLVALAEDAGRRDALRAQVAARPLRTWGDYADDVLAALAATPAAVNAQPPARPVRVVAADAPLAEAAAADVVAIAAPQDADRLVEAAAAADAAPLLPHRFARDPAPVAAELERFRRRLTGVARIERAYGQACRAFRADWVARPVFLRIVISTYNRREFVLANVRWLLDRVMRGRTDVELVVVDNASTDGTEEALQAFHGRPVRVVVNPANVGMLGNMRVCSQLPGAEYVWLIGDDDFIMPGEVDPIIAALKANFGVPLAYVNFGVYMRQALGPADRPEALQGERFELAPNAIASGVHPVNIAAAQHDNLFTAIYINIWRSDVLAAAYDHPFDGRPFGDLVESIPCTKTILESFGEAPCYWHKPIGIVGNGYNSWARHRPRWHGLLMPQALHLARDAGVDPVVLRGWAQLQGELYDDARGLAREAGRGLNMDEPDAFDLSWPSFRRRVARTAQA